MRIKSRPSLEQFLKGPLSEETSLYTPFKLDHIMEGIHFRQSPVEIILCENADEFQIREHFDIGIDY